MFLIVARDSARARTMPSRSPLDANRHTRQPFNGAHHAPRQRRRQDGGEHGGGYRAEEQIALESISWLEMVRGHEHGKHGFAVLEDREAPLNELTILLPREGERRCVTGLTGLLQLGAVQLELAQRCTDGNRVSGKTRHERCVVSAQDVGLRYDGL